MEELSYNTKIAVVKVLTELLNADHKVHANEVKFINAIIQSYELQEDYIAVMNNTTTDVALSSIKDLPANQKEEISQMMGKMIVIDKDINYNEVKLYNQFCESCGICHDFNIDEYPDYSLNGSFAPLKI